MYIPLYEKERKRETGGWAGEWNLHIHRILTQQPLRRMYHGQISSPVDKTGSHTVLTANVMVGQGAVCTRSKIKKTNKRHLIPIDEICSMWTRARSAMVRVKNAKNFFSPKLCEFSQPSLAFSLSLYTCLIEPSTQMRARGKGRKRERD